MDEERRKPGRPRKLIRNMESIEKNNWLTRTLFWAYVELDKSFLTNCVWKGEEE